jgi:hypothetical protein
LTLLIANAPGVMIDPATPTAVPTEAPMVKLDRKSSFALSALDSDERALVESALGRLRETNGARPDRRRGLAVTHLPTGVDMLTVTPDLAIFFREDSGDILVEDIFPPARLRTLGIPVPTADAA